VGGNESYAFPYQRHNGTVIRMERAVSEFWLSIERGENRRPSVRVMPLCAPLSPHQRRNHRLPLQCAQAFQAKDARLVAEKEEHAYKAEIIRKMRGAEAALCQGFRLTRQTVNLGSAS